MHPERVGCEEAEARKDVMFRFLRDLKSAFQDKLNLTLRFVNTVKTPAFPAVVISNVNLDKEDDSEGDGGMNVLNFSLSVFECFEEVARLSADILSLVKELGEKHPVVSFKGASLETEDSELYGFNLNFAFSYASEEFDL